MKKAAIYVRTSTTEQNPEKQKEECMTLAENRGYEVIGVFSEQISGYKNIKRPEYEYLKEMARKGEIQAIVVWALDRWVRNRDTLIEDIMALSMYNVKIHSVNESWIESINIEGPVGKTLREFLFGITGAIAELESKRKSERAKMAYKYHSKKKHHDGKKWGRPGINDSVKNKILKLRKEGKTMKQIKEEVYYWDDNNNKKSVSIGVVHKVIKEDEE
jgi:DNA invertase Pin-like site-specific DNA recombinase